MRLPSPTRHVRRLPAIVVWILVVAATLAATLHLRAGEERDAREDGRARAAVARAAIERDISRAAAVMAEARSILAVQSPADAERVHALTRGHLASGSSFVALAWHPRVPAAGRRAFEERTGLPITEAAVSGLQTARRRSAYLPAELVYGRGAPPIHGADESSLPMLRRTLEAARDAAETRIADPLPLGPEGEPTARMYTPVYRGGIAPLTVAARRAALAGVVSGSIDVALLEEHARAAVRDGRVRLETAAGVPVDGDETAAPVTARGADWTVVVPARAPSRVASTLALVFGAVVLLLFAVTTAIARRGALLERRLAERERAAQRLRRQEAHSRAIAEEHAAFRVIATAIASDAPPEQVYDLVARQVAELLGADAATVARFGDDGEVAVVGCWSAATGSGARDPRPVDPGSAVAALRDSGVAERVVRGAHGADGAGAVEVALPVRLRGRLWGAVAACAPDAGTLAGEGAIRLLTFAELLEIGIARADAHRRLAEQASSDPLTGMANHRVFHERLRDEVARARRHGRPLGLALIDLDHFKHINDTHGHQVGDTVLTAVARLLAGHARASDVLARVGGEEFAWLMPETDGLAAFAAAERARTAIAQACFAPAGRVTVSAGVCDLDGATDGADLYRRADEALYWAKSHGRDLSCRYSPQILAEPAASPRPGSPADDPLLALVQAVEEREGAEGHGARVGALSGRIAERRGWAPAEVARLIRAARVHDVGKIGVPPAVLGRPGPLPPAERALLQEHAELGARIGAAGLDPDQVAWIRGHHERWDGAGVPDGLAGAAIPEGARIIAAAETWDAMTTARPYAPAQSDAAALEELRRAAGAQLCPFACAALERVLRSADAGAGTTAPT